MNKYVIKKKYILNNRFRYLTKNRLINDRLDFFKYYIILII